MNKSTKKLKAFTLIEILIATGIFSVVMVMTSGVISQSSGYQSKLQASRAVSEESRKIADAVSRDLRLADGNLEIKLNSSDASVATFKSGVVLFQCASSCKYIDSATATAPDNVPQNLSENPANYKANALIVFSGDKYIFYHSVGGFIYSRTMAKAEIASWSDATGALRIHNASAKSIFSLMVNTDPFKVSSADMTNSLGFIGYTAADNATSIQSYVGYYIHTQTADYDNLAPFRRSETYIRSMITVRNYAK